MTPQSNILASIVQTKKQEVTEAKLTTSINELKHRIADSESPRGFEAKIRQCISDGGLAVIAECKKASPSKGVIREDYNVSQIVQSYQSAAATCLSVLTDQQYFQGNLSDLHSARLACSLPILRKDFIVDPFQVYETRANGADCMLLIVSILEQNQLIDLAQLGREIGLDILVEVHSLVELEVALHLPFGLIGINNRNLRTFETTIDTTLTIQKHVPDDRIVVTESGIHTAEDVSKLTKSGLACFLVGEAFMRNPEPGNKLKHLFFESQNEMQSAVSM